MMDKRQMEDLVRTVNKNAEGLATYQCLVIGLAKQLKEIGGEDSLNAAFDTAKTAAQSPMGANRVRPNTGAMEDIRKAILNDRV